MLTGTIVSLASAELSRAQALAASVAKLTDREPTLMYYRKVSEGEAAVHSRANGVPGQRDGRGCSHVDS